MIKYDDVHWLEKKFSLFEKIEVWGYPKGMANSKWDEALKGLVGWYWLDAVIEPQTLSYYTFIPSNALPHNNKVIHTKMKHMIHLLPPPSTPTFTVPIDEIIK